MMENKRNEFDDENVLVGEKFYFQFRSYTSSERELRLSRLEIWVVAVSSFVSVPRQAT
jgi:hypothetical protein